MSKKRKPNRLTLQVKSGKGLDLSQAQITLEGPEGKLKLTAKDLKNPEKLAQLSAGKYKISVTARGYEPQVREIELNDEGVLEPFFLGKKGQKMLFHGKVQMPVDAPEDRIGLNLTNGTSQEDFRNWIKKAARKLKVNNLEINPGNEEGTFELVMPNINPKSRKKLLEELRQSDQVAQSGASIDTDGNGIFYLGNNLTILFKGETPRKTIQALLSKYKLRVVQTLPGVANGYLVEMPQDSFHEPFDVIKALSASKDVISASPDGNAEIQYDFIPPRDAMWLEHWHHVPVGLQAAWTTLRANNQGGVAIGASGDKTYGDENLILSVVDSGIHTITPPGGGTPVSATHDFAGNVTSGQPKIYRTASLSGVAVNAAFVWNNDTPTGNHGMNCAGAAMGRSNNPPTNGIISEGIVGSAPNIRALGVISTGSDVTMRNMFIWSSGLPTGNNNFPQISPGIDITSNSWGFNPPNTLPGGWVNFPSTTFRPLTLYGRKGRGVLMFFSAGNGFMLVSGLRPLAGDQLTFGIGASTINALPPIVANEINAPYSAFGSALGAGAELDLVAPSHSQYFPAPNPGVQNNPNASFGAISTTSHSEGRTPGGRMSASTLAGATAVPLNQVTLGANANRFRDNMILVIDPGGPNMGAYWINRRAVNVLTLATNVPAGIPAGTNVIGLQGHLPGSVGPLTATLSAPTAVASAVITVNDTSGLVPNQMIYFGAPGTPIYQQATIAQINSHHIITLSANAGAIHPINTPITGLSALTGTVQSVPAIAPPALGSSTFQVNSIAGLVIGQQMHLAAIGAGTAEVVTITGTAATLAPAVNPTVTVTPQVQTAHGTGTPFTIVGGSLQTQIAGVVAPALAISITVQSSAGFQIGQGLLIGAAGGGAGNVDYNCVRSIPNATTINLGRPLINGHGIGVSVIGGSPSYTTTFGGTSFATPLSAGIAGLVLTAKPTLTWIEVKNILRGSATQIMPGHASWVGIPAPNPLAGRNYSPIFAYGRVNAQAAVTAAIAYNHNQRDLMIRNSLLDNGLTAGTQGETIIDSPDIWVRNTAPTAETTAIAIPAAFATAGPHQKPVRGGNRWIYVRVSNRGNTLAGLQAWLRTYIAVSDGEPEFNFPDAWINFGAMANIGTANNNLYLLNPVAAAPNLNGTSLFAIPAQPQTGPNIPALAGGIPANGNHVLRFQWNQAQIPSLPLPFASIQTFAATVAGDTIIHLDNTMRLVAGQQLLFGAPGAANHRARTILTVDAPTRVTLTANIGFAFPVNTTVIPISPSVATSFNGVTAAGAGASNTFNVNDASNFKLGQHILLGNPGNANSEIVTITNLTVNAAGNDNLTVTPANTNGYANSIPITLVSNPLRTFVVAEVTPHDGLLAGDNFYNNNNISYKEVNLLADLDFMNQANNAPLTNTVNVDETGAAVTTNFRLNMVDGEGFTMENVSIKVTRHHTDPSNNETITYRHNAGAWGFDTAPAAGWLVCNAPLTTLTAVAAAGAETGIHFTGTFQVDDNHNKVTFIAVHTPPAVAGTIPVQVKYHEVVVFTLPPGTSNLGLTQSKKPKFHIWTDMAQVNDQLADDGYGPVSTNPGNLFNLTSLFGAAPAATVPAYATVTGTVFIQRNATDATKVNLFLKPLNQSKVGFTAVKYFVYRGLKLTDFLKGTSAADELKAKVNDATASPFLKYVYAVYDQLKTDAAAPAAELASKALGWDPPNQGTTTTSVDRYFYATDPNFQLPIVPIGMELGNFHTASGKFGFEIILEEGIYSPDLANARLGSYRMDLTVGALTPVQIKAKREEILNYIDPAAYYGMHFQIGVETKDAANRIKKENDLFTAALAKYITRNKVYIDIRNESGYSYHYYSNYDDGSGNQIQIGDESTVLVASPYHTNNWPVIIRTTSIPVARTNAPVFLTLRVNDNKKPLVYVEWTELTTASKADKFVSGTDLNTAGGVTWTKPMGFATPNVIHPTDATQRIHVSQVVKVNYFRELDATTVWPTTVFKTDSHLANLFGPLEAPELFTAPADDIEWVSAQDKRFVDNSGAAAADRFAYIAERGVAQEDSRVIYWASASEQYDTTANSYSHSTGVTAGTSTKGNFFEVAYMFRGLRLEIVIVKEEAPATVFTEVRTLKLKTVKPNAMATKNLMVLGITEAEATLLKNVAGFAPQHERNLVLVAVANSPFTDPDGKIFHKYRLRTAGLNPALNYFVDDPASNVFVYSTDGHFFCSKAFGAAQPDPVYYGPSMEERIPDLFADKVGPILATDATTESLVNDFTALAAGIPNDANAKTALSNLATTNFGLLWAHSAAFAKLNQDNRPYYLARNKMRYELRRHPYYLGKDNDRDTATTLLEGLSRNYTGASFAIFPAANKKILVLGIDCNALLYETVNPSSTSALALHGDTVTSGAISGNIQGMVLPLRYSDYNQDVIKTHFNDIIKNNSIDMIFLVAQEYHGTTFNLERIAARKRGGDFDNENQKDYDTIGATTAFAQFYETNLPIAAMHPGPFPGAPGQWLYYNEAAESVNDSKNSPLASVSPGPNGNANSYLLNTLTGESRSGSSGNYIPNEVFYRLSQLQSQHGSTVKVGMITIPPIADVVGGAITMAQAVQRVKDIITLALPSL